MFNIEFEKDLEVTETSIPGLKVVDLAVHGDSRGWFKENWQRAKMRALGLPDFRPVQNNVSFNAERGVTRGIHAEPWDKYISVATGSVFGAWVDLRPGATFGEVFTCVLDPSRAIYVPRGVGNSFQALEDGTAYTYLVNAHWSAELKATYTFVNLADPALGIEWPIPLSECTLSEADKGHPVLADALPMEPKRTLVLSLNSYFSSALRSLVENSGIPGFEFIEQAVSARITSLIEETDWSLYGSIIYVAPLDDSISCESTVESHDKWLYNAEVPARLSKIATEYGITLVKVSSSLVFGDRGEVHTENDFFSPSAPVGIAEAAGDVAVFCTPKHYLLRTGLPIGYLERFFEGGADRDCFIGSLSFAEDVAAAMLFVLGYRKGDIEPSHPLPVGGYNCACEGGTMGLSEVSRFMSEDARQLNFLQKTHIEANGSTFKDRTDLGALDSSKLESFGFSLDEVDERIKRFLLCGPCDSI